MHWTVSSLFLYSDDNRGEPKKQKTDRLRRYEPDFSDNAANIDFLWGTVIGVDISITYFYGVCCICQK